MFNYDQPFHAITLLRVASPTAAQIKRFREVKLAGYTNFLELRSMLQQGGFQGFGVLLEKQAADLSAKLDEVGIPHRIDRIPDKRIISIREK